MEGIKHARGTRKNTRVFKGVSGSAPHNRAKRLDGARKRFEARSKLTARAQLAILDSRLGEGVGAIKERERLNKLAIEQEQAQ